MASDYSLDEFRRQVNRWLKMRLKTVPPQMRLLAQTIGGGTDPDIELRRVRDMIDAMTDAERENPDLISESREFAIAAASGTPHADVERFLVHFGRMRQIFREIDRMSIWQRIRFVLGFDTHSRPNRLP